MLSEAKPLPDKSSPREILADDLKDNVHAKSGVNEERNQHTRQGAAMKGKVKVPVSFEG